MRSCPNCGAQFSDKEVFCPVCGQEVQMVPDFVTAEIQLQELHKKIEEEERAQKEARERAEMIRRRIRQRRNHVILIICLIGAAVASWFAIAYYKEVQREHSSFSYQYEKAKEMYEQGDLVAAGDYVDTALSLRPDDRKTMLLEAHILLDSKKRNDAENLLYYYLEKYPDEDGYVLLIDMYLDEERTEDVQTILMDCPVASVLEKYARFLPAGPVMYPEEGVYNKDQDVYLTSEVKGKIYYTTDGSDPTSSSTFYDSPISLSEGIYTIKAMLITDEGFPSPVTAGIYQIQYDAPPPPQITPDSGRFTVTRKADADGKVSEEDLKKTEKIILSYPEGFVCHYSFDQKPTKDSPVYKKPIEMKQGEHIFYAVLESDTGKLGMIASATYIYDVQTITPTPKPTQKVYYYGSAGKSQQTPVPTPAPTEAPAPSADPGVVPTTVPDQTPSVIPSDGGDGTGGDTSPAPTDPDTPVPDAGGGDASGGNGDGQVTPDGGAPAPDTGGGDAPAPDVPAPDAGGGGGDAGGGAVDGGASETPVNSAPAPAAAAPDAAGE